MKIVVKDPKVVEYAAKMVGVKWVETADVRRRRDGRFELQGVLRPLGKRFRRKGFNRKSIYAVCWHGHYSFISQLFNLDPDAIVKSCLIRRFAPFMNKENFEKVAWLIHDVNIGSVVSPEIFGYACYCE